VKWKNDLCHQLKEIETIMTARKLRVPQSGLAALATSIATLLALAPAHAQFEITGATGNTAQEFDSLISSGTNQAWVNDTTLTLGDSTLNGWSLFNSLGAGIVSYNSGDGGSNTGNFYSFGAPSTTERSLGGTGSGGAYFGSPLTGGVAGYIAFSALNNSAATLNAFTLGFDGEQWRNGGNASPQTMALQYGFGANFTDVTSWVSPGGSFDWVSPVVGATAATVDGNVAGLVANRGGTINGLDWQTGQTLWIRWIEVNDAGNDHGLGIDKFSLSWTGTVVSLLYWDPNGATGGIGGTGTWSATNPLNLNWNPALTGDGIPQTSDATKRLVFGGAGGTITLDGAVAANIGIEATAPYTITSGTLTLGSVSSINISDTMTIASQVAGANGLLKLGTGVLTLTNAANSFTGNISINAGALAITDAGQLGTGTKVVSLAGGLLSLGNSLVLSSSITLNGTGSLFLPVGATLTTQGNVSISGVTISSGSATHSAGGTLALNGATNAIGSLTLPDPITIEAPNGITLSGNVTVATGVTGPVRINGPVTFGAGVEKVTVPDTPDAIDFLINGTISGTGRLHKVGDGVMRINGVGLDFTGGVRMGTAGNSPATSETGGRLLIADKGALGTGQLEFNDGTLEAEVTLTGANALPVNVSVGAGQLNPATFAGMPMEFLGDLSIFKPANSGYEQKIQLNTDVTFRGLALGQGTGLSGGVLVTGASPRTLTFSGTAATVGTDSINIDGPTLVVQGALTGAVVTVRSGSLRGSGQLGGLLTIGDDTGVNDSFLEPGLGVGTLSLMSIELKSDAVVRIQIDFANGLADQIIATDFVTLGSNIATLQLDFVTGTMTAPRTFVILDNSTLGVTTGFFKGLPDDTTFDSFGNLITIDYNAGPNTNDVVLTIIPEPASVGLLAVGALALNLRRRRRF
jgi:autotransporter-associated beta strand protein